MQVGGRTCHCLNRISHNASVTWLCNCVYGGAPCAVRKVGCFPPPVATDPRVLNSAPYSPCWYTRDIFFSLLLAMGPRVLQSSAPHAVLNGSCMLV